MLEVKLRVANIVRFVSMILVMAALLLMYAYGTDDHSIRTTKDAFLPQFSKATIFYTGLGVFAVFNLLMNWGIRSYREAKGYDPKSLLFKSEHQKAGVLFWIILLLAALNFLLGLMITYIGFIKIEGPSAQIDYIALPVMGISILCVVLVGLLVSVFRPAKVDG